MQRIHGTCGPHRWSDIEKIKIRKCFETLRRREHLRAKKNLMAWLKKLKDPMDLVLFRKEVAGQLAETTAKSNFSFMYGLHIFSRAIYRGFMDIEEFSFLSDDKKEYLKGLVSVEGILKEKMPHLHSEETL